MEAEIKWKTFSADSAWDIWGEVPMIEAADAASFGEDLAQLTRGNLVIDIGYYSNGAFGCVVIKDFDWGNPLEKEEFDHGQDAYDWAIEMMKKYG